MTSLTPFQYKYDFLVFIGRFEPFHNGHKAVITSGLGLSRRLIILVGSANRPRSYRNPFTYEERVKMITDSLTEEERKRVIFKPISDHTYNDDAWLQGVQKAVKDVTWNYETDQNTKIGLIGHSKDASSYYLNLFPQWGDSVNVEQHVLYNATDIRQDYFTSNPRVSRVSLPENVQNFLVGFTLKPEFKMLVEERNYIVNYKKSWKTAPYPPIFVTVDAIVTQSAHVLLIERKDSPGKGLWALPGGFLDQNEYMIDGVLRELDEETGLKVPTKVLRGSIKSDRIFDAPNRSDRGRVITRALHIGLPPGELPKIKGKSDAKRAKFVQYSALTPMNMFEDHYDILETVLGLNNR